MHITYRAFDPTETTEPAHSVMFESKRFRGALVLKFHAFFNPKGPTEYVNVGFELRERRVTGLEPGAASMFETSFDIDDPTELPPRNATHATGRENLDVVALERIVLDYSRYLRIARSVLEMQGPWPTDDEKQILVKKARRKGRGRRGLDSEFWALLAAEVETRRAQGDRTIAKSLAQAHDVDPSTASRWLKRLENEPHLAKPATDG